MHLLTFDQTTVEIKQQAEESPIEPVIEPKAKAKARSTPKKKPKATTVEQEAEVDSNNEVSHDVVDKPIIKETVSCPNSYKVMAPKTLKYNHKHTCPAKDKTGIVNSQTEPPVQDHFKVLADEVFEKAVEEKIKQIRKSEDNRKKRINFKILLHKHFNFFIIILYIYEKFSFKTNTTPSKRVRRNSNN